MNECIKIHNTMHTYTIVLINIVQFILRFVQMWQNRNSSSAIDRIVGVSINILFNFLLLICIYVVALVNFLAYINPGCNQFRLEFSVIQ